MLSILRSIVEIHPEAGRLSLWWQVSIGGWSQDSFSEDSLEYLSIYFTLDTQYVYPVWNLNVMQNNFVTYAFILLVIQLLFFVPIVFQIDILFEGGIFDINIFNKSQSWKATNTELMLISLQYILALVYLSHFSTVLAVPTEDLPGSKLSWGSCKHKMLFHRNFKRPALPFS